MPKKNFIPNKLRPWIEARKKYRLSHAHIQMARELGMSVKCLDKLNNSSESWKAPLHEFIEDTYFKQFKKVKPDCVKSIEQMVKDKKSRKEARKKESE